MSIITPSNFRLQWHITDKCNFRCKHCYQEKYSGDEMTLEQMGLVLEQYVALIKKWHIPRNRAAFVITGGEPFMRPDLFRFLARVYKNSNFFHWGILSNGSLLTRDSVKILKLFGIGDFQVSLEGLEKNTDKVRGRGVFKKTLEALKLLIREGVETDVSLTCTIDNSADIFPLMHLLADIGVRRFLIRRLVPMGSGSLMRDKIFEPDSFPSFFQKINECVLRLHHKGKRMQISFGCESAVFFLETGISAGQCLVFGGLGLVLMPNGDVLPCRRLPIVVGNILKNSFEEIYFSKKITELRNIKGYSKQCQECRKFDFCLGGARCISYAATGRLDFPDPQCKYARNTKSSII